MHTTVAAVNETDEQRSIRFGNWYDRHFEEPTVITVHQVYRRYGGPEEGGWYYTEGWPVQNICIFSKEQAVEELLRLHSHYETKDEYWGEEYAINLASSYAKFYPEHKPYYE